MHAYQPRPPSFSVPVRKRGHEQVDELKAQLKQMGLPTTGLKAALAERLSSAYLRYVLVCLCFLKCETSD